VSGADPDMHPERLNILCLSQMPPSPPQFGAQARMHGLYTNLARRHDVAIVCAKDDDDEPFPEIDEPTAGFTYARLMSSSEDEETGVSNQELSSIAKRVKSWAKRGDVFAYFIAGAKVRNPAAARALIEKLK